MTTPRYNLLGENAPELPESLPKILNLATQNVPEHMKPAILNSLFPAFGSLMHHVGFRYPDNVYHEPHFMCGIVGPMSLGKGAINPVLEAIIRSLREHDISSYAKLNEWKRQSKTAGANKSKPARPEDAAILAPEPDMTNPALIQLLMDAENEGNRFLYTNIPEIDLLDQCCGSHKKVTKIIRLAFDLSRLGAQRATADGVSGNPTLRWNFNFSCVEQKAIAFFRDSLLDGTLSRIGISYVQRPKLRTGIIPRQGIYDERYQQQLDAYLVRLQAATGEIACPQANHLVSKLSQEMAEIAMLSDDENFEALSYRSLVIAWLKACVLYVANGCKWTSSIADFMRWSLYYDLWSKLALFAPKLRENKEVVDTSKLKQNGPTNMLDLLPERFTYAQLVQIRQQFGRSEEGTRNQLKQWKHRGFITSDGDSWLKAEGLRGGEAERLRGGEAEGLKGGGAEALV